MMKRLVAVLPVLCLMMIAMGGSVTAPTAAAPSMTAAAAPAVTAPVAPDLCAAPASSEPATSAPAAASSPADEKFGSCRWYCGSKSYPTASQCAANCRTECEEIC